MRCRSCRIPMEDVRDARDMLLGQRCPTEGCGYAVQFHDPGYQPWSGPEVVPAPFKPLTKEELRPDAAELAQMRAEAAERRAMLDGAMLSGVRKARQPIPCGHCGTLFQPGAGNALYCQTQTPRCVDQVRLAREARHRRSPEPRQMKRNAVTS